MDGQTENLLGHIANVLLHGAAVDHVHNAFGNVFVLVEEATAQSLIARNVNDTHRSLFVEFFKNNIAEGADLAKTKLLLGPEEFYKKSQTS